jgi:hypothetical protein
LPEEVEEEGNYHRVPIRLATRVMHLVHVPDVVGFVTTQVLRQDVGLALQHAGVIPTCKNKQNIKQGILFKKAVSGVIRTLAEHEQWRHDVYKQTGDLLQVVEHQ